MSEQWQIRRGTWAEITSATPSDGEMWWSTDTGTLVIGDGNAQGGIRVIGDGPGDFKFTGRATVEFGYLLADGRTLGPVGSGANLEGVQYRGLYNQLWEDYSDATLPMASGTRGASAAADWSGGRAITIPDRRGRTGVGASAVAPLTPRAVGATYGAEAVALARSELPNERLATVVDETNNVTPPAFGPDDAQIVDNRPGGNRDYHLMPSATLPTIGKSEPMGDGNPHNNEQPSFAEYVWIKF